MVARVFYLLELELQVVVSQLYTLAARNRTWTISPVLLQVIIILKDVMTHILPNMKPAMHSVDFPVDLGIANFRDAPRLL